jgi:hypothetical protein
MGEDLHQDISSPDKRGYRVLGMGAHGEAWDIATNHTPPCGITAWRGWPGLLRRCRIPRDPQPPFCGGAPARPASFKVRNLIDWELKRIK